MSSGWCLALLNEVSETGDTITVTKRGRPVATLQRVKKTPWKSFEKRLGGQS
jgi:prevent-host-death family protein